jgi:hypothetical protein
MPVDVISKVLPRADISTEPVLTVTHESEAPFTVE